MNINQFSDLLRRSLVLPIFFAGSLNALARPPITEPVDVNVLGSVDVNVTGEHVNEKVDIRVTDETFFREEFYVVPSGKRLIIEYLSCSAIVTAPGELSCGVDNFTRAHYIATAATTAAATPGSPVVVRTGQIMNVFFEEGTTANFIAAKTMSTGSTGLMWTMSGRLVNID